MKLLTKTYSKDLAWLQLAMVSVARHCREEVEWTIICDQGERPFIHRVLEPSQNMTVRVFEIQEHWPEASQFGSGYIQQQWVKMTAHRVMGEGYFLNWDSDVIALREFTSDSFKNEMKKPILWFTPFNDLIQGGDAEVHRARQEYIKNIFQIQYAPFEWMRCMPLWMNGSILKVGESHQEWNRTAILLKSNQVNGMSEFNLIGAFSHMLFPDAYDYKNTNNAGPTWAGPLDSPTAIVHQSWSWGGVNDQVKAVAYGK